MKKSYSYDVLNFGLKIKKAARIVFGIMLGLGLFGLLMTFIVYGANGGRMDRFFQYASVPFIIFIATAVNSAIVYFLLTALAYHFIGLGQNAVNTDGLGASPGSSSASASISDELPDL